MAPLLRCFNLYMDIDNTLGSIINKSTIEPIYFKGFSANIIPGTISAPGFNLNSNIEEFNNIKWGLAIKIVNSSEEDFAIENISSEWRGQNGFLCKSDDFCTKIYKLDYEKDEEISQNLLSGKTQLVLRPFLIKKLTEIVIKVNFTLKIFKHKNPLPWILEGFYFSRNEIREPETYHMLYQKNFIKIKLNGKWKSISLKASEFLVAGDIIKIPDKN